MLPSDSKMNLSWYAGGRGRWWQWWYGGWWRWRSDCDQAWETPRIHTSSSSSRWLVTTHQHTWDHFLFLQLQRRRDAWPSCSKLTKTSFLPGFLYVLFSPVPVLHFPACILAPSVKTDRDGCQRLGSVVLHHPRHLQLATPPSPPP